MNYKKLSIITKIIVMFLIMLLTLAFFNVVHASTGIGNVTITKERKER